MVDKMDFIIDLEPFEVLDSLINAYEDDIYKSENPNRYTKFDTDNDSFLGKLGEFAFKKYLLIRGYEYGYDFYDVNNLPKEDYVEIENKKFDKYDFGINISEKTYIKVDVKTQYCVSLNAVTNDWQMAINENTINKINDLTRNIDYFAFIFCDKMSKSYKEHIEKKYQSNNPLQIIQILQNNRNNADKIFQKISVKLVGMISSKHFIDNSEIFLKGEIFRINITSIDKINYFDSKATMYRIFIHYLMNVNKLIPPKYFNIDDNRIDMIKFKEWIENAFRLGFYEDKFKININNIDVFFPLNKTIKNMQYSDYDTFLIDMFKKFINSKHIIK